MIQAIPRQQHSNEFIPWTLENPEPRLELQGGIMPWIANRSGQLSEQPEAWVIIDRGMKGIYSRVGNTGKGQRFGVVGAIEPSVCFQLQWHDRWAEVQ